MFLKRVQDDDCNMYVYVFFIEHETFVHYSKVDGTVSTKTSLTIYLRYAHLSPNKLENMSLSTVHAFVTPQNAGHKHGFLILIK